MLHQNIRFLAEEKKDNRRKEYQQQDATPKHDRRRARSTTPDHNGSRVATSTPQASNKLGILLQNGCISNNNKR